MAQFATLCFSDRDGTRFISAVTQGQKEGTHINLVGANDWNGRDGSDRAYLLAPYDCVVKAIGTYDNTIFFESTGAVQTPTGVYDHCWFMCTHILDTDKSALGLAVGKKFVQGQPCYAEGTKGVGSGNHIHMEQGYGSFGGGTSPYHGSSQTFKYNGTTYKQYYPVLASGAKECPVREMFYIDKQEVIKRYNGQTLLDRYSMQVVPNQKSASENQVYVGVSALRVRAAANTSSALMGYCAFGAYYNVLEKVNKANSANKDYDWYKIGPNHWIAGVDGVKYTAATEDKHLVKIIKDSAYDYQWSIDGNQYGDKYDVTIMAGFGDRAMEAEGWEEVLATNGGLFYTYENAHYANGLEKSRGINNQDVGMSAVSSYNNAMAIGCLYGDGLVFAKQSYIVEHLDSYYGAITGMGIMLSGKEVDYGHSEFKSQWNSISGRTIIGEDEDGNPMSYSIAGTTGSSGLYGKDLYSLCKSLGFYNAILLDGGGSVWRRVNGKVDISTSRKVKNAVLLYRRKKKEQPVDPDPSGDTSELVAQITKLQNELAEKIKEATELAQKLSKSESECGQVKSKLNETEEQLSVVKNDLTTAQTKIANAKKALN